MVNLPFQQIYEPGETVLVMLHGTGGNEQQMLEFGRHLSKRTGILSIRGKEPEEGVNRWFRRFGEGVFDEANLQFRARELAEHVIRTAPESKRIAVGFSNGANIASAIVLLRPEAFDGAVLLAPMVPFEPTSLPDLAGKPILMVCSERDPIVPRTNAQALATMFETAGADLTLHWHAGGHMFGQPEINLTASWIAQHA